MAQREKAASSGGHAERFVARCGGIDGGTAVKCTQLRLSLWAANRDGCLAGRDFHVGANGNARNRHSLLGSHNADRERVDVLGKQKDLLACVHQAADRKHGVVFADVRIKENRIASGIDDRRTSADGYKSRSKC